MLSGLRKRSGTDNTSYLSHGWPALLTENPVFLEGTHLGLKDACSELALKRISAAGRECNVICSSRIG